VAEMRILRWKGEWLKHMRNWWSVMPHSLVDGYQWFGGACYQCTWCHIPEYNSHDHLHENLRFHIVVELKMLVHIGKGDSCAIAQVLRHSIVTA
jgi:hypothetical protein